MVYKIFTGKGKYRTSVFISYRTLAEAKAQIKRIKASNKVSPGKYVNPRIKEV